MELTGGSSTRCDVNWEADQLQRFRGGPDAYKPSRLATGWGLRSFRSPVWERLSSTEGRRVQSAAGDSYNSACEEPKHLYRTSVRGQRSIECRGVYKCGLRRFRRWRRANQSNREGRHRLHPAFLWSASSRDRSRCEHYYCG